MLQEIQVGSGGGDNKKSIKITGTTPASGTVKFNLGFKPKYATLFIYKSANYALIHTIDFEKNKIWAIAKTSASSSSVDNGIDNNAYNLEEDGFSRALYGNISNAPYVVIASE